MVSEKGHDSQGIMRADILSAVERSRKSSKAPKFPVGDKVEVLTADQLAERYPEGDSQYVVKTHNGRYLDFRNAQDVAWMRFNDCDSNPTHTVHVWEGEKTDENPTGWWYQILLIAAKFNPNEEQTINYNEAARAHDPDGRYAHSSTDSSAMSIERLA